MGMDSKFKMGLCHTLVDGVIEFRGLIIDRGSRLDFFIRIQMMDLLL